MDAVCEGRGYKILKAGSSILKLTLQPFYDEDISKYIKKVQFKLHETYTSALRVIEKPPFEVTETGWGEFEVQIKIYFSDVNEKQVGAVGDDKGDNLDVIDKSITAADHLLLPAAVRPSLHLQGPGHRDQPGLRRDNLQRAHRQDVPCSDRPC